MILTLFEPIVCFCAIVLIGLLVGRIKMFGVSMDIAAVLGVALFWGATLHCIDDFTAEKYLLSINNEQREQIYRFMSLFGTALFISSIGIDAGFSFVKYNKRLKWRAFLSGVVVVLIGVLCTIALDVLDHGLSPSLLSGMFSGSMTSTPALSQARELCSDSYSAVSGYGITYCGGLFSVVIFIQLMTRTKKSMQRVQSNMKRNEVPINSSRKNDGVWMLLTVIVIGYVLGTFLRIGVTGGILLSGLFAGYVLVKKRIVISSLDNYRQLGLLMFFVGTGIPSGASLTENFSLKYIFLGLFISITSIVIGYFTIKKLFGFTKEETLAIICGGMTSTPAIGILKKKYDAIELAPYTVSYVGALITLLLSVRMILLFM